MVEEEGLESNNAYLVQAMDMSVIVVTLTIMLELTAMLILCNY